MNNSNLILVGAIITVLGGVFTAFFSWKESKSSSKQINSIQNTGEKQLIEIGDLKNQNDTLNSTVDSLNEKILNQNNTIDGLRNQNTELSIQLTSAAKMLYGNITGGDSYCMSFIRPISKNQGIISFIHQGKFPLYDVQIRMVDLELYSSITANSIEDLSKSEVLNMNISILSSYKEQTATIATEPVYFKTDFTNRFKAFNIFYITRNSKFTEEIRLYDTKDGWVKAIRVFRSDKLLFEKIEKGFPISLVDWKKK